MATTWWLYVMSLQNILACPLMQLGDGDGERGEAEDGDEEDGEGTISPNLSNKGHTFMCNMVKYVKATLIGK